MKRLYAVVSALCVACGGPATVPHPTPSIGVLVIKVDGQVPERSQVAIDDQAMGPLDFVAARGVSLPVGAHRMTVTAPGYLPFDRGFDLASKRVVVTVALRQVPD